MGLMEDYRELRYNEGRRAMFVSQCLQTDPGFNVVILAALRDYDEQVRGEAVMRYLDCDIVQRKAIVPTDMLRSLILSASVDDGLLAVQLLPGRDDIEINTVRALFKDGEYEILQRMASYYRKLSLPDKEALFSLGEIEEEISESRGRSDVEGIWSSMFLALSSEKGGEATERTRRAAGIYIMASSSLSDCTGVVVEYDVRLDYEMTEKIAQLFMESDDKGNINSRRRIMTILCEHVDESSITSDVLQEWLSDYSSNDYILTELAVTLIADKKVDGENICYDEFYWPYLRHIVNFIVDEKDKNVRLDYEQRFKKACELYEMFSLSQKMAVAPERHDNTYDAIRYRIDEGVVCQYMIAHLCYGRIDLEDDTLALVSKYISRKAHFNIFRRSLNSIYVAKIDNNIDKECISKADDDPEREKELERLVDIIRRLIVLDRSVVSESKHGNVSDTERNVMYAVLESIPSCVDNIVEIANMANIDAASILQLPQIKGHQKIIAALQLIAAGKVCKGAIVLLKRNKSTWAQITNNMILNMSKSDCPEAILFAVEISEMFGRDVAFREEVIFYAISGSDVTVRGQVIAPVIEKIVNDDELRQSARMYWALLFGLQGLDCDSVERARDTVASMLFVK